VVQPFSPPPTPIARVQQEIIGRDGPSRGIRRSNGASAGKLGLRMGTAMVDAELEHVVNDGHILRTHILRPTWHFVAPGRPSPARRPSSNGPSRTAGT
jgi:hypothetical protein